MKSKIFFFLSSFVVCCVMCVSGCQEAAKSDPAFKKDKATDAQMAPPPRDQKKVEAPAA
jgi:hypothetical protein